MINILLLELLVVGLLLVLAEGDVEADEEDDLLGLVVAVTVLLVFSLLLLLAVVEA